MKKHIRWVILGAVLALFLWLIYTIVTIAPVYPNFLKQVDSYEELQKALKAAPEVCFPDSAMLELTDASYYVRLDDRTIFADPEGYAFYGTGLIHGVEANYGMDCVNFVEKLDAPDVVYRGVPMMYYIRQEAENLIFRRIYIFFCLGDHYYTFDIDYDYRSLTEEEINAMDAAIQDQLLKLAQPVVDCYLENSKDFA